MARYNSSAFPAKGAFGSMGLTKLELFTLCIATAYANRPMTDWCPDIYAQRAMELLKSIEKVQQDDQTTRMP